MLAAQYHVNTTLSVRAGHKNTDTSTHQNILLAAQYHVITAVLIGY